MITLTSFPSAHDRLLFPGNITFTCTAVEVPSFITIGWFFNDHPIKHFEFVFMEHNSYPLVIANETFEVIVESAMLSHTTGTMNAVINLTVDSSVLVGMNLNKLSCGLGLNFIAKSLSVINFEIPSISKYCVLQTPFAHTLYFYCHICVVHFIFFQV